MENEKVPEKKEIEQDLQVFLKADSGAVKKKRYSYQGSVFFVVLCVAASAVFGALGGLLAYKISQDYSAASGGGALVENAALIPNEKTKIVKEESSIIDAVKKVNPAVVSIIITENLPKVEQYYLNPNDFFYGFPFDFGIPHVPQQGQSGTEKQVTGQGSGFVISKDGYIVTNKHVVANEKAEYTVLMNDGKKYKAEVVARDPASDIAIIKINASGLAVVEFGDSNAIEVGQIAIAIGNALGEYKNTVSAGVVSGLKRSIIAGGSGGVMTERLNNLIQTDAAINPGNSGGPLLNSSGQVVGMNTAIATGAEGIGFAIPVNDVKKVANDVITTGRIVRPFIGVRYMQINEELKKKNGLSYDYGALIIRGRNDEDIAIIPASPADKVGLMENDIILEADGIKLDDNHSLSDIVAGHNVGDEINLKISHKGNEKSVKVKLEERK